MVEKQIIELFEEVFRSSEFSILSDIPVDPEFPYQNYIGVNFDKDKLLNLKLYFSFFTPPDIQYVKKFIPESGNYEKFIAYYTSVKERSMENNGITFSIKINSHKEITTGFHFRIKKDIEGFPDIKAFKCFSGDLLNVGICEEFKSGKSHVKYYYYFTGLYNKEKFAVRFSKPHLVAADLIEYTESESFNKVIGCNLSDNIFYSKFLKIHSRIAEDIDDLLVNQWGLNDHIAHGFYENSDIEAKYYFRLNQLSDDHNHFSLQENKRLDTIKFIREKLRQGNIVF
ncbi:MAG: hypothetical protein HY062_06670 [Bacteroidetes bacterium]|nr:hypothetical protein [Bacteroidota bacterium]